MKKSTFLVLLIIFAPLALFAQNFTVFNIDTTAFPLMKASFYAYDGGNIQIKIFNPGDFKIFENGEPRDVQSVSCPPAPEPVLISLAISIDISGSMLSGDAGVPSVELGKTTATNILEALSMPPHEAALQTCHAKAFINQDFTADKQKMLDEIKKVQAGGDNDFVEHLLNPRTGLLNVAKTGKNKRAALLCTDAWWNALTQIELDRCIDTCKKYGITFYAIIYTREETMPNGIKASLKALADATGGKMYDGVIDKKAAADLANELSSTIQLEKPCTIEWMSDYACKFEKRTVEFKYNPLSLSYSSEYNLPVKGASLVEIIPPTVRFTNLPLNIKYDTTLSIKSVTRDLEITDIKLSNSKFSVSPKSFSIKKGESKNITLSCTPTDSVYEYCKIDFLTNYCNLGAYSILIYGGKPYGASSIKVTFPNGGESFAVGSDTVITWEGTLPEEEVALDYSADNGASWTNITKNARNFSYGWTNLPNKPSPNCLMRAKTERGLKNSVLSSHTGEVNCLAFSPNGYFLASGDVDAAIKIWDTETGTLQKTINGHSESVYNLVYSRDGSKLFSGGWDNDIIMWDTKSWQKIRTFNKDPEYFTAFTINSAGTILPCGMMDNSIKLLDAATAAVVKTFAGHSAYVNCLAYNSDNSLLASGSSDYTVKIWDMKAGALLRTLTGHNYPVTSVSFSPDGSTLASGASDNSLKVWNAKSGALLKSIDCGFGINSVAFSLEGDKVAVAGSSNLVKVYSIVTGEEVNSYSGHNEDVLTLAYNHDGSALASGSSDKSVRIWGQGLAGQSDVSDAVWAIVKPEISARDIDCGKVLIGKHKDTAIVGYFINKSPLDSKIKKIEIKGANAGEFNLISTPPPFDVSAKSAKTIEIHFEPKSIGNRTAYLEASVGDTILRYKIIGQGVNPMLEVAADVVDFGKLKIGSVKDTLAATINNLSQLPVEIQSTEMLGPDKEQFAIINGGGPFTLMPGESWKMELEFRPTSVGRTSGSIGFNFDGFPSPVVLQLFGEGLPLNSPKITSNSPLCKGDDIRLFADSIESATYHWYGPNNFFSSQRNVVIENAQAESAGRYFVSATISGINTDTAFHDVIVKTELVAPGDSSYIYVGSARKTNNLIQLTESKPWDGGSIWLKNRFSVKKDFETTFEFIYRNGHNFMVDDGYIPGADGFAFVMQNHNYPFLGEKGGSLGYKEITNSLAIEVDLWANGYDPNGNHIAVQSLGAKGNQPDHSVPGSSLAINPNIITLKQDSLYYFKIKYDWNAKNLKVYIDTTDQYSIEALNISNIDLSTHLALEEGEYVYIGFTSGTGESYQEHYIQNWTIPCLNQIKGVGERIAQSSPLSLEVFPNPVAGAARVEFKSQTGPGATLKLVDLVGVERISAISLNPGLSSIDLDLSNLEMGTYFLIMNYEGRKLVKKLTVIR